MVGWWLGRGTKALSVILRDRRNCRWRQERSIGGGTPSTLPQCRKCSTHGPMCKIGGLPYGATSRRVGSGCGGQKEPCSSLHRGRDPKQLTIWWTHPRGRTCPILV